MADTLKEILRLVDLVRDPEYFEKHIREYKEARDQAEAASAEATKISKQLEVKRGELDKSRESLKAREAEVKSKEATLGRDTAAFLSKKTKFERWATDENKRLQEWEAQLEATEETIKLKMVELSELRMETDTKLADLAEKLARYQAITDMLEDK